MAMSAGPTPVMGPTKRHAPHELDSDEATFRSSGMAQTHRDEFTNARFKADHPLFEDLAPADSYKDGVYWVSLVANSLIRGGHRGEGADLECSFCSCYPC